jgi:hypothetical protein
VLKSRARTEKGYTCLASELDASNGSFEASVGTSRSAPQAIERLKIPDGYLIGRDPRARTGYSCIGQRFGDGRVGLILRIEIADDADVYNWHFVMTMAAICVANTS